MNIAYLEQAYFVSGAKRQDMQGKKIFESGEKYLGIWQLIGHTR